MTARSPADLIQVPLFALLEREKAGVWAAQIEIKRFSPCQRIYKHGGPGKNAYFMMSGKVGVTTVDEDGQEVLVDEPQHTGDFFGFASTLEATSYQGCALARRNRLPRSQPRRHHGAAGAKAFSGHGYMLTVLGRQFHAPQQLIRLRASRNENDGIDEKVSLGSGRFGGTIWRIRSRLGINSD
jgi:CRP/FNR family transcriptional regulator, cyclic AMP receptor protein